MRGAHDGPLGPQSSDGCNIVHDCNPQLTEVLSGGRFKEVFIRRAKNVRFTDDCGLHHNDVVHVADWRGRGSVRALGRESWCRERSSLMRTIAGANSPHGLVDNVLGFRWRAWFTAGVHFRKILLQLCGQFVLSFLG
jgi:hypothetical protein